MLQFLQQLDCTTIDYQTKEKTAYLNSFCKEIL